MLTEVTIGEFIIEVYDIFGLRKYQKLNNVLLGGDNFILLDFSSLSKSSIIIKVTNIRSIDSKAFINIK